ncbi:protein toll-like [Zophobas morio]|uniref:protein toll-like n=1 Tax=Zophobas morio TaxID=2755281 RepID=UPI003082DB38
MSHNKLKTIAGIPRRLKVLELDHNHLSALSSDFLRTLDTSHLVNVSLKHNPWICTCGSEVLTNFVRKHAKIMDFKQIYCSNSTIPLVSLNQSDLCKDITLIVTVVVISLLLLPAVFSALFYKFQQPIKVWMFSKNLCLWWVAEEDLDRNKVFDAFISYSSKDVDFFVETLIPELEKGPEDYKLCVDFRNWTPGELISSSEVKSINESKRPIIIHSQKFLKSV